MKFMNSKCLRSKSGEESKLIKDVCFLCFAFHPAGTGNLLPLMRHWQLVVAKKRNVQVSCCGQPPRERCVIKLIPFFYPFIVHRPAAAEEGPSCKKVIMTRRRWPGGDGKEIELMAGRPLAWPRTVSEMIMMTLGSTRLIYACISIAGGGLPSSSSALLILGSSRDQFNHLSSECRPDHAVKLKR